MSGWLYQLQWGRCTAPAGWRGLAAGAARLLLGCSLLWAVGGFPAARARGLTRWWLEGAHGMCWTAASAGGGATSLWDSADCKKGVSHVVVYGSDDCG